MDGLTLVPTRDGVRLGVHARPRAKRSRVVGAREGALVVQLSAPPVDGAANAELLAVLAEALGVPQRDVVLVRGEGAREKLLEIRGIGVETVRERLAAVVSSG